MAIIEFKNEETEKAFMKVIRDTKAERIERLQQLNRKVYLLRNGLWSPYW